MDIEEFVENMFMADKSSSSSLGTMSRATSDDSSSSHHEDDSSIGHHKEDVSGKRIFSPLQPRPTQSAWMGMLRYTQQTSSSSFQLSRTAVKNLKKNN